MSRGIEKTFGQRYSKGIELLAILTNIGTFYNPVNEDINLVNFSILLANIKNSNSEVAEMKQKLADKRYLRKESFHGANGLKKRMGKIRDYVSSMKEGKNAIAYKAILIETQKHVYYTKSKSIVKTATDLPEVIKKKVSNAETGFGSLLYGGKNVVEVLKNMPNYSPQNTDISLSNFQLYLDFLATLNSETASLLNLYNITISERKKLYEGEYGLLRQVVRVKNFIASIFGKGSQEYKAVLSIKF